ncbi:MAG: hypothetical protein LBL91_01230 [Lachnospiraceae bacterium]|jgi:hypothetical protein|nr:hypothetical protein [Lachnospiraceae bacterium]
MEYSWIQRKKQMYHFCKIPLQNFGGKMERVFETRDYSIQRADLWRRNSFLVLDIDLAPSYSAPVETISFDFNKNNDRKKAAKLFELADCESQDELLDKNFYVEVVTEQASYDFQKETWEKVSETSTIIGISFDLKSWISLCSENPDTCDIKTLHSRFLRKKKSQNA